MTKDQADFLVRYDANVANMKVKLNGLDAAADDFIFAFDGHNMGIKFEGDAPVNVAIWVATAVSKFDKRAICNGLGEHARIVRRAEALFSAIRGCEASRVTIVEAFAKCVPDYLAMAAR